MEARDPTAEAELDRLLAAAYLYLLTFRPFLTLSMRRPLRGDNHAGDVRLEYSNLVVAWALS